MLPLQQSMVQVFKNLDEPVDKILILRDFKCVVAWRKEEQPLLLGLYLLL